MLAGRSTALCFSPHCRHSLQAPLAQRSFLGSALGKAGAARAVQPLRAVRLDVAAADSERLRLHNLSPQKGSRRDEKRKGRGYGGHQVGMHAAWQQRAWQACNCTVSAIPTAPASGSSTSCNDIEFKPRMQAPTHDVQLHKQLKHMLIRLHAACCGVQGGTCGFGNRGQKARSGPSVRPGFEGGQTPLYRRLPKLRGIAGGEPACRKLLSYRCKEPWGEQQQSGGQQERGSGSSYGASQRSRQWHTETEAEDGRVMQLWWCGRYGANGCDVFQVAADAAASLLPRQGHRVPVHVLFWSWEMQQEKQQ
jgi:hypothetical protein